MPFINIRTIYLVTIPVKLLFLNRYVEELEKSERVGDGGVGKGMKIQDQRGQAGWGIG